jgi:ferrochelatase
VSKKAIILFNLGGPASLAEVRSFLFNLFYDKAIIRLPNPVRYLIARLISSLRTQKAQKIYSQIGGRSPILENTIAQAKELEKKVNRDHPDVEFKVFVCMRYSAPFSADVVKEVIKGGYGEILLVPLYPQFSSTTTKSSYDDFIKSLPKFYSGKIKLLCCYPTQNTFISAHAELINEEIKGSRGKRTRILFSAHGLPESVIKNGDPYQWQVEQTVNEVVREIGIRDLDYKICYQSRVGPMKWIGPSTEDCIKESGQQGKDVVLVPIAFVSEHSETLVELDLEYRDLAISSGVKKYKRVKTLSQSEIFIESLSKMCMMLCDVTCDKKFLVTSSEKRRICPQNFCNCMCEE